MQHAQRRTKRAHHKDYSRHECATPGCGNEAKRGRLCTACSFIYHNRMYHARKWREASEEELMAEVARTRKAEKQRMKDVKEASVYVNCRAS